MADEKITENRFSELAERAGRSYTYQYTEFHSPSGASIAYRVAGERDVMMWGGTSGCERVVVRFGNEEDFGYSEEFPIKLIIIKPKAPKFADRLTHRDFLGALMNLGLERDTIGDIVIRDNVAFVFVLEQIADFVVSSLERVKHTPVKCEISDQVPDEIKPKLVSKEITVASERFDTVIAKLFNLSRSEAKTLFDKEAVIADGRAITNPSSVPKEGTIISVRGHGKFVFDGIVKETKKGRLKVLIRIYS